MKERLAGYAGRSASANGLIGKSVPERRKRYRFESYLAHVNDESIKNMVEEYFQTQFMNFGGDELLEGPCNNDEAMYTRVEELLQRMELRIEWL